jgi:transposase
MEVTGDLVTLQVASTLRTCACPGCGSESHRVHSWYLRRLQDLPWHGLHVQIQWRTRRFFCNNAACNRKIFVERLPEVGEFRSRRTSRLMLTLRMIGLACGGEPGARLANRLGMTVSGDSLLKFVRSSNLPTHPAVQVIGVDDWAYRRGQRYGTLICNLETHRPIDLLPDRAAESFEAWLLLHPGIKVVARDRGDFYARGADSGAPQAIQVADRWHLLRNISDVLRRLVDRHPRQLAEAWKPAVSGANTSVVAAQLPESPPAATQAIRFYRDARRRALYDQVHLLSQQGKSQREIARELEMDRETVQRYLRASSYPERPRPCRRTPIDPYRAMLWERWRAGCRNAAELYRELVAAGFTGSYYMVGRCLRQWRQDPALAGAPSSPTQPPMRRPSGRRVAWLLTRNSAELSADESTMIERLLVACPEIAAARKLAAQFVEMVRNRQAEALDPWMAEATASASPKDLQGFARGLQADLAAVRAALELPWSNGQTEGHIHRLKALKRQMYGRAGFDLLRIRVLNAA